MVGDSLSHTPAVLNQELRLAAEAAERQRMAEEQRLKEDFERRLRENQNARGFIRPAPLDPNCDWRVQVLACEARKGKVDLLECMASTTELLPWCRRGKKLRRTGCA